MEAGPKRPGNGAQAGHRPAEHRLRSLFGTDGVRGVAGELLTAELAVALGRAAAAVSEAEAPQVLIVRDTRESGEMLEASLAAGVAAGGGHALLGGVLPTPGAALLLRRYEFDLAAVVSASHNPYRDNGIKFFGPGGTKLSDEAERSIEEHVAAGDVSPRTIGRVRELHGATGDYLRELELRFGGPRPQRRQGAPGLRPRRHLPGGARDLPSAGCHRRDRGRRARRAQHQRRLWLDPHRPAGPPGGRRGLRPGIRLRRRRRPRACRGPKRRGGGRRRAAGPRRASPPRNRAAARRGCGRDRDDQLRLPPGDGEGRRRGGDHASGRQARPGRAAAARLGAWRRAVGPHHRDRLRPFGRRRGRRAAVAWRH